MSSNMSNMIENTFREYNNKIILQVVTACANIHNFDVDETMKQIMNINENSNEPTQNTESVIMPIKKKRGRPKKVKTEVISNSYVTGKEDPILSKLMNAMNKNSDRKDIHMEDELQAEKPIECDEEEFETTLFTHDGVEYLKSDDGKLYENSKDNKFIGTWDQNTQTIISC